jgi:hypothetical protein
VARLFPRRLLCITKPDNSHNLTYFKTFGHSYLFNMEINQTEYLQVSQAANSSQIMLSTHTHTHTQNHFMLHRVQNNCGQTNITQLQSTPYFKVSLETLHWRKSTLRLLNWDQQNRT